MATIRNANARTIVINYVGGNASRIVLYPGVNLGVDDYEWGAARKHPIVAEYLERGTLDVLKSEPEAKGEILDLEVTESPHTDEPLPILDASVSAPADNKPARKPRATKTA